MTGGTYKRKMLVFVFCQIGLISGLYAQTFTPRNGTAYAVDILEWKANGQDIDYPSRFSAITVNFYADKVELKFDNIYGTAYVTFYHDGSFEQSSQSIFTARSVYHTGTGKFERSGKDFIFSFITEESDGSVSNIVGKGKIK